MKYAGRTLQHNFTHMAQLKDINIGKKLNLILGGAVIFIIVLVSLFSIFYAHHSFSTILDKELNTEINNLDGTIELEVAEKQTSLLSSVDVMSQYFSSNEIEINKTHTQQYHVFDIVKNQVIVKNIPELLFKNNILYNDSTITDRLAKSIHGKITIDQKVEGGFVSIATNIKKQDGTRTINGFIPDNSELGKKLSNKSITLDRANILGTKYISVYAPIIQDGKIVASIIAAIEENDMNLLRETFYKKKFLDSGYAFLLRKDGRLLIHPDSTEEGSDISDEKFFTEIINSNKSEGQIDYEFNGEKKILFYKYNSTLDSYIVANVFASEYNAIALNAAIIFGIVLVIASFLFIIVNRFIVQSIKKPLNKCVKFSDEIANGNIMATLNIDQKDELGQLAVSLRAMSFKIKEVVQSIRYSSEIIVNASNMVTETSQALSNSSNEQASTIEEVSSTMEEMVSAIKENSFNAENTNSISLQAQNVMEQLFNESTKLVKAVNDISGKINIINDIAMQTNILSLNARVEAAKAGVEGRGFSVVAEEIRRLADVSKTSADQIIGLSKNSIDIAVKTGEQINELMPRIKETTNLISGISAASNQQYNGAEQVNFSMQQVNESIQSNAGSSEELANSAQQLNDEVHNMQQLIAFFKIEN